MEGQQHNISTANISVNTWVSVPEPALPSVISNMGLNPTLYMQVTPVHTLSSSRLYHIREVSPQTAGMAVHIVEVPPEAACEVATRGLGSAVVRFKQLVIVCQEKQRLCSFHPGCYRMEGGVIVMQLTCLVCLSCQLTSHGLVHGSISNGSTNVLGPYL